MRRSARALAAPLVLAGFALTPAAAEAPAWAVDYAESSIAAKVTAEVPGWGPASVTVKFPDWAADIRFSPEALDQSRVEVTVDMTSLTAGTSDVTKDARSTAWLGVETHPKAIFTAQTFEPTADGRYVAKGTLDLHGLERPLDLVFDLEIEGDRAEMTAEQEVSRTAWEIDNDGSAEENNVADAVTLKIEVQATRP